jgi:S1-C subfamily serine protease
MSKTLLSLLLAALPLCVSAEIDRAAFVALAASVLRVEAPRPAGGFSLGSGVAVADDTVVTNCHVTRDAARVNVIRDGIRWPAQAQVSDVARDLCLLRVPGLAARPVTVGRAAVLQIGQPVTALGYTGGLGLQNSAGEVLELHHHDGGRVIQSSNWFSSGASGGGLFDDDGRLVGILTFRLRGGEAHYFAAPSEWVLQMVDAARQGGLVPMAPLDPQRQPYWQLAAAQQPRFLQAASLLRDDRWRELEHMADEWSRAEPDDGEAWFLLGEARQMLGQTREARQALACALQLEPARAAARQRLADMAGSDDPAVGPPCRRRPA